MNIILLHRDLRMHDNPALFHGTNAEEALVIFVYDKNYWQGNGKSTFQLKFALDCLREVSDNLKRSGAYIAGIRPGEQTANYIDSVLARLTVFGAIYLTLICLLPLALINFAGISPTISVGGTSVLIIVVVLMDFMAQVQSHMMSSQYASLMKKANLKNYKR